VDVEGLGELPESAAKARSTWVGREVAMVGEETEDAGMDADSKAKVRCWPRLP
jgi:hypothetical protein